MSTVEVKGEGHSYVFSPYHEPVAHVQQGDQVIIHTEDCFGNRIRTPDDLPSKVLANVKSLNPQTGPIFVEGAEPGDTLSVYIQNIEPTREYAVSCFINYFGGLTCTGLTRLLHDPLPEKVWIWELMKKGRNRFFVNEELGVDVPWEPFMGTFAVSPNLEAFSTVSPGPFGGNMDVKDIRAGNTVFLPVFNPGALFYTGDAHGNQGQGELCGVALEMPCKVTLVFEVIKRKAITWPRIESERAIMTVGSARPMEDAARIAYAELISWMEEEFRFSRWEAYELLTLVGQLYVGNMVDTTYSLVASIDKNYLKRFKEK